MYTKFIIVTDDDIDARWEDVIWAMTTRMDELPSSTAPIDYLDFASPVAGLGSKMGMDATHKWEGRLTGSGAARSRWTVRHEPALTICGMLWVSSCPVARLHKGPGRDGVAPVSNLLSWLARTIFRFQRGSLIVLPTAP